MNTRIALPVFLLFLVFFSSGCNRCMALPDTSAVVSVTDADGNPVPEVQVTWRGLPTGSLSSYGRCSGDEEGVEFVCGAGLETEIIIEASAPGFEPTSQTIIVEWGKCGAVSQEISLQMEPSQITHDLPESACVDAAGPENVGVGISRSDALPLTDMSIDSSEVMSPVVRVRIEPRVLVADGISTALVTATVSDLGGHRVRGQQVTFSSGEYSEDDFGNIYGGLDEVPLNVSMRLLPSMRFVSDQGLTNLLERETGEDGTVTVEALSPAWEDYMHDKPQLLTIWYNNDGNNPRASTYLCFIQP